jgi:hypothetical protein
MAFREGRSAYSEAGARTQAHKYILSPVTILTFADPDDQQSSERYAYKNFSGRNPL